jgi:hypothetical protein
MELSNKYDLDYCSNVRMYDFPFNFFELWGLNMSEFESKIVGTYKKGLKDNYIKSLVQGMEVATQM